MPNSKTFKHQIRFPGLSRALTNGKRILQELSRTFREAWLPWCSHIKQKQTTSATTQHNRNSCRKSKPTANIRPHRSAAMEAVKKWDGGRMPRGRDLGMRLWSSGVISRRFLKIQVQICAIWCIFGDQCNKKCTTQHVI